MTGILPICYILLTIFFVKQTNGAHREHKVHNIVLYPDKHSWCQTQQIKQVISYPGCKSEEIDNNVCVGACFSYSIPHTEPSDPGEVIVPYCDSCQPSDTTWHHITLQCEKNSDKTPPQLVKRVQIINNCSCSSCESDPNRYKATLDENEDTDDFLLMQQNDIPDLLRFLNTRNESNTPSNNAHAENMKSLMNHKIVTLLKDIQEKNSRYDKDQLTELLRTIQGPDHHKINDEKIADFVESLNSENVELDLVRLREVLSKFEHSKYFEKHRKYILGNNIGEGSNDLNADQKRHHHHHHHGYHPHELDSVHSVDHQDVDIPSDPETLDSKDFEDLDSSSKNDADKNDKGDELSLNNEEDITPPAKRHQTGDVVIDTIINHHKNAAPVPSGHIIHHQTPHHHHHLHQHHHVGEEIMGHGHLIQGPNGALVIEPDRIHEKLDVNPHELKPNHAGTFLSYSGQSIVEKPKSKTNGDSEEN